MGLGHNRHKKERPWQNTLSIITANMNSINQVLTGSGEYTQLLIAKEKCELEEKDNN